MLWPVVGLVLFALFFVLRGAAPKTRKGSGASTPSGSDRLGKLIKMCQHDRAMAERLIEFELGRDPSLSRADAIRQAITRLEAQRS